MSKLLEKKLELYLSKSCPKLLWPKQLNQKVQPAIKNEEQFLAEVISLLAWFQHRFVWIHPFKDYNGRLARLLTNLLVLNYGLPVLEIKAETGQDRQRYIKAMQAADEYNFSKLENLLAKALEESLRKV